VSEGAGPVRVLKGGSDAALDPSPVACRGARGGVVSTELGSRSAEARTNDRPKHRDRLADQLDRGLAGAGIPPGPGDETPVTGAAIAGLPESVQRYMRFMGVAGRPRDWSFRACFVGRFRLRPSMGWMPAEAWQYNSAITIARVFVLHVRLAGLLPMTGRDVYINGHGRMLGKLLGLITVADGKCDEFDIGELTTYLNDALLIAPSFLLRPEVEWAEVDAEAFDVSLRDAGRIVGGRVFIDESGKPIDFATNDRFADLPGGLRRAEWRTPISEWFTANGRVVPGRARAVWNLPEGEFSYIEGRLDPDSIAFNVAAGVRPSADRRVRRRS
jgi:Family of unknown function (DUF6544)